MSLGLTHETNPICITNLLSCNVLRRNVSRHDRPPTNKASSLSATNVKEGKYLGMQKISLP